MRLYRFTGALGRIAIKLIPSLRRSPFQWKSSLSKRVSHHSHHSFFNRSDLSRTNTLLFIFHTSHYTLYKRVSLIISFSSFFFSRSDHSRTSTLHLIFHTSYVTLFDGKVHFLRKYLPTEAAWSGPVKFAVYKVWIGWLFKRAIGNLGNSLVKIISIPSCHF